MLTRILHNSEKLCTWYEQLGLELTKPQRQHLLNMMDGLLVCEGTKTIAALQRQLVEGPDASNMADFLRISPWQAMTMRDALRMNQLSWLVQEGERQGWPKEMFINIDDSLGEKDKGTRHLEPVAWHHDHAESSKGRPRYKNGFCYLLCTVQVGSVVLTVDLRLYLRERTVRRLNRNRAKGERLSFRSKYRIARQILVDLKPLLPKDWQITVQFDSWYASHRLIKFVRRQGWHVTCGLKCNRKLNGQRIDQLARSLRHKRYTRVQVSAADGNTTTYYVRHATGHLVAIPHPVRVLFCKRHHRDRYPAYFTCTDRSRSSQKVLRDYHGRWSCEVDNRYLKSHLGLADFRVHAYEAVDKYLVIVLLTWAYVEGRFYKERSAQVKTYGDIIRRHRDEQAIVWLEGAIDMAVETGDKEQVLKRFLRL